MRPSSPRRLALVAAALAAGFAALAVPLAAGAEVPADRAVLEALRPVRLDGPALAVDRATRSPALAAATALLAGALLVARRARDAAFAVGAVGGVLVLNPLLKQLAGRPRPVLLASAADVSPLSFPSGHAAGTAALGVSLGLLAAGTRWALAVAATAVLLVAATAAAELVLARHHPSDLLGGWLWATAWVLLVAAAMPGGTGAGSSPRRCPRRRR